MWRGVFCVAMGWACVSSKPGGPAADPKLCVVSDKTTLADCQHRLHDLDEVRFTAVVECSSPGACFDVEGRETALLLSGVGTAGLRRLGTDDGALLSIDGSHHITVRDLSFEDAQGETEYTQPTAALTATSSACRLAGDAQCAATLHVGGSSDVTFDGVTVRHARSTAIELNQAKDITVSHARVLDAWLLGLVIIQSGCSNITIEDSEWRDGRSNALVVSGEHVMVRRNTFVHNHYAAAWWSYPGAKEPSSGGQVFIYNGVEDVELSDNEITGGGIDEGFPSPSYAIEHYGLMTIGVEIDYAADLGQADMFHDVRLLHNDIHGLYGVALSVPIEYLNSPEVALQLHDNRFYDDAIDPATGVAVQAPVRSTNYAGPMTYPLEGNCFDVDCTSPQPAPLVPPPPVVNAFGAGCENDYGAWLRGDLRPSDFFIVVRAGDNVPVGDYVGDGMGPFTTPSRTDEGLTDDQRTLSFCFASQAERDAFDGSGVRVFVTDPFTWKQAEVSLSRADLGR